MDNDQLAKIREVHTFLSQNLADSKASFKAVQAYRHCNPEGLRYTAQLLCRAAEQLAYHANTLVTLAAALCDPVEANPNGTAMAAVATDEDTP